MQRKPSEFFHTYRPWQGESGTWYVLSNLTSYPTRVSQHPDEESARDHARVLNGIWEQERGETRQAWRLFPPPLLYSYRSESLACQLKNFWVDIALYFRYLFRLR
jgi:hypothetical protein